MQALAVPPSIRGRLGNEASDGLAEMFTASIQSSVALSTERFERRLSEEVAKVRVDIADFRADVIRWCFVFWIGQVAAIAALFSFMLRYTR